MNCSFSMVKYF